MTKEQLIELIKHITNTESKQAVNYNLPIMAMGIDHAAKEIIEAINEQWEDPKPDCDKCAWRQQLIDSRMNNL